MSMILRESIAETIWCYGAVGYILKARPVCGSWPGVDSPHLSQELQWTLLSQMKRTRPWKISRMLSWRKSLEVITQVRTLDGTSNQTSVLALGD